MSEKKKKSPALYFCPHATDEALGRQAQERIIDDIESGRATHLIVEGYDENLDLALLKMSGNYNSIELANSNNVQIGEKVIAIGNPLGLQFSVSEGIVSAIHREGPNNLEAYIQTDAALNPGNSGGPLINSEGDVIGINNFKSASGESLGFALEANELKKSVNNISENVLTYLFSFFFLMSQLFIIY